MLIKIGNYYVPEKDGQRQGWSLGLKLTLGGSVSSVDERVDFSSLKLRKVWLVTLEESVSAVTEKMISWCCVQSRVFQPFFLPSLCQRNNFRNLRELVVMRWEAGVVTVALLCAKQSQRGASSSSSLFSGSVVCHLVLKYILGYLNSNDVMWLIPLNSVVGI